MTSKHFVALAKALALIRTDIPKTLPLGSDLQERRNEWQNSVNLIADVCAESNPRFDRSRFIAATLED